MTAVAANRYSIVSADIEGDRTRILDFWQRIGFTTPDRVDRYDWFHLQNPEGRGRIYLMMLEGSDQIVGTACAGTRLVCMPGGTVLRASVLVDFAVDPAHRSLGPALTLQRTAREHEMLHSDLLYGLPDTRAVPIFKRLGADVSLREASHAYVVRSGVYLRRKLPRWASWIGTLAGGFIDLARGALLRIRSMASGLDCTWSAQPPAGVDQLWSEQASTLEAGIGVRNRPYLAWRFRAPEWRFAAVTSKDRSRLHAYMACRLVGEELHIGDLLLSGTEADRRRALQAFLVLARREPVRVVRADLLAPPSTMNAMRAAGFSVRDERPLFLVRNPAGSAGSLVTDWWFTKADEDV